MPKYRVMITETLLKGRDRLTLWPATGGPPITFLRGEAKEVELHESVATEIAARGYAVEPIKAGKAKDKE